MRSMCCVLVLMCLLHGVWRCCEPRLLFWQQQGTRISEYTVWAKCKVCYVRTIKLCCKGLTQYESITNCYRTYGFQTFVINCTIKRERKRQSWNIYHAFHKSIWILDRVKMNHSLKFNYEYLWNKIHSQLKQTITNTKIYSSVDISLAISKEKLFLGRIWGSHSGGYEEYYLLGYNAM
jgi:hypothetical protein